jgi:hypothetical protein
MAISVVGLMLLVLLCVGAGFLLIKAPKVFFAILGVGLLISVPLLFYARQEVRTAATVEISPSMTQVRGPIIVSMEEPTTQPAQPSGKAWVDDWGAYINSRNRSQSQMRAGTTSPWGSEEDARREARRQASVILLPRVSSQVRTTGRMVIGRHVVTTQQWLQQQIEQSLAQGQFVVDEYVKVTDHPYGQTWTCQVLLDDSQATISRVASQYNQMARQQMESTAITWGGIAALSLVTLLLYAFLNSVTKGYFMWRLRAAAAMIVLIAVLAVMWMA